MMNEQTSSAVTWCFDNTKLNLLPMNKPTTVTGELQVLTITDTGAKHWNTLYRASAGRAAVLMDMNREAVWIRDNHRQYLTPHWTGEGRIVIDGEVVTYVDLFPSEVAAEQSVYDEMMAFEERFLASKDR